MTETTLPAGSRSAQGRAAAWLPGRLAALLGLAAILASGCAAPRGSLHGVWFVQTVRVEQDRGSARVQVRYRTGQPGSGWAPAGTPPGEIAFVRGETGLTLYADSSCGARYHDAPLDVLINHQLFGFTDLETLSEEDLVLSDRAARQRIARGLLDGVPVQIGLTVTKKGPCVFDLVMLGPPSGFAGALPDYLAFLVGFEAQVGP